MKKHSPKRILPLALTLGIVSAAVAFVAWPTDNPVTGEQALLAQQAKDNVARVWPIYGGNGQRNMINTVDKNIPDDWEAKPGGTNIKWAVPLGSRAYGGPVVAGGKLYVGTNNEKPRDAKIKGDKGVLMCFSEANGDFLWQAVHDKLASGQVNDWPKEGVCSTPAIEGNRVYYVNNRCEVICADVDPKAGTKDVNIIWKLDMMKEHNVFPHNMAACSPVLIGDLVFIVTANGVDEEHISLPSPNAPSFIAVDKKTGKTVWKDASPGKFIMHGQWSNPTVATVNGQTQVIFPGGDGWLYAFEPKTGKLIWKFDGNPKDAKYELGGKGTKSDWIATPVVVGNQCFIGTGQDPEHYEGIGHLWCIDITKTGDLSPELVTDAKADPPKTKPNPNSAVVWHYGGAVKKEDADKINRDYYFGRTMSTVSVIDGLVYAAELAGYLHCVDAKTGKQYWQHDLKAAVWGSTYYVDGKVMICTEDGDVWIFAHGKEKKEPKRVEMGQPVRSSPVVVNGVLYIMTESHLYAIAKK